MRQRLVNEKAAAKTLSFLKELSNWCKHIDVFNMSDLIKKHGVSKSTGSACLKLNLVEKTKDAYKWISPEPERADAIRVLELLRLRNDKMVAIPLGGFESLVDTLKSLVTVLKPRSDAARQVGNYKESAEREKQETFIKILSAISTGVYGYAMPYINNPTDGATIETTNDFIIAASNDLLTKIYK